ncbi:MAG: ATP-binding protein [Paludibacteraceae bacterium]|nr:ATP-binding protein [Paludibacteraceae bacterium]
MIQRIIDICVANDSIFLFGARQTGKTTLLSERFPNVPTYDLLERKTYERLQRNPALLEQELAVLPENSLVIIDEIPLLPELLDQVHRLIVKRGMRFILCGSSTRKLKRQGVNTLAGRALPVYLYPLVSAELEDFDLFKAVNQGMLPRHYLTDANTAWKRMQAYVAVYLKEEIKAESLVRNLQSFNRFMEIAALTDGEMVNYSNIASDCGVDSKTVKEYFSILQDTLVGFMVPAYAHVKKRKLRQAPKFYYMDVAIPNYLLNKRNLQPGSADFGHAFEHLMMQEIVAYLEYNGYEDYLTYWHTYNNYEVDAVLGDAEVAIEFKSCQEVQSRHLSGLKAFKEEHPGARLIIVSLDEKPRIFNGVEVLPATEFLKQLWNHRIANR